MTSKRHLFSRTLGLALLGSALTTPLALCAPASGDVLAYWRFEQVAHLTGDPTPSVTGESLTASDSKPVEPRPFAFDDSGKGNYLQVREPRDGSKPSPTVFSDDIPAPQADGKPNSQSLALKHREYFVTLDRPLCYYDLQKSWTVEASLMSKQFGLEQVFLCKEGAAGTITPDLAIGYDSMEKKFFVEVKGANGESHRLPAGSAPEVGKWYDVRAQAAYDAKSGQTTLSFSVKPSAQANFTQPASMTFKGTALPRNAGSWVVGRGFPGGYPNSLYVIDGGIDEIRITGEALPRVAGQNPLFTDAFTADPAATVVGDTVYAYVGHDVAQVGQFFNMPDWLCYSSKDMKNWTPHGPVMKAADFAYARPGVAWAAQMIEAGGKYYFYVTLTQNNNRGHCIAVAVANSPLGPFKDARGTPLITDDMTTDSSRVNTDIDPTIFIDDDGTPWLAWGNGDCYMVKLKRNMIEFDGPIQKVPFRNYSEGPWLFKRGSLYYNVYAADAPGVRPEQIAYSTAPKITGPWTYRGILTGAAKTGFTIHPAVIEFKKQWYFFYHDGSTTLNGMPGGDCRRSVCAEYLYFNEDGTIQPITQTSEGVSVPPKK